MAPRLRPLLTPPNDGTQKENKLDLRVALKKGAGQGVEDEILDLAERSVAPSLQLLIQQLGGAADLRRRQALDPNSRITASTSRVDTPLMYISATASMTARTERRPRSSDCG